MSERDHAITFLNKKLLFNEDKLQNSLYDSLTLFDKLKLIKNYNKQTTHKKLDSISDIFNKNIGKALFFAINIIIIILGFIWYAYSTYMMIKDYSFAQDHHMQYFGWAFLISFVIVFGLCVEISAEGSFEVIPVMILLVSTVMCVGLNLLIGYIIAKILYTFIKLYQVNYSNGFKSIVDDIEFEIMDNYFNQIVYTPDKRVYYLHEIIQSINFEDHKNINNVDKLIINTSFNIDQFLLEKELTIFSHEYGYPNLDEKEALKLLLKNNQARSLNFKQLILKLKQLERLTRLNESQKQNELNQNQFKEKYEYLDKINQLAKQFKSHQYSVNEINEKQFNSMMNYK